MHYKTSWYIMLGAALILLLPLLAMLLTDEVSWDLFDFGIAWILLTGAGLTYNVIAIRKSTTSYRIAAGLAVATTLLLVWANLAVGLIGSEDNPANMLYLAVLAVGFIGTLIAGLKPRGMSYALLATAVTQALVPVIAMLIWNPPLTLDLVRVFAANTFFVVLFVGSALLFRHGDITST